VRARARGGEDRWSSPVGCGAAGVAGVDFAAAARRREETCVPARERGRSRISSIFFL